jgi:hypothetical protein
MQKELPVNTDIPAKKDKNHYVKKAALLGSLFLESPEVFMP